MALGADAAAVDLYYTWSQATNKAAAATLMLLALVPYDVH